MIHFENETKEITGGLQKADGYLKCESLLIKNIKKHAEKGIPISSIEQYLRQLHAHFKNKAAIEAGNPAGINYVYATAFLQTVIATPYWKSWIIPTQK